MSDPLSHAPRPRCVRHGEPLILECRTCRRLETDLLKLQARGAKIHADAIDADCDRLERERDQLSEIIDTWGFAWMEERQRLLGIEERGDLVAIRCTTHLAIPVQNRNEHSGGECGGCIATQRDALSHELKERGVDCDTLTTHLEVMRGERDALRGQLDALRTRIAHAEPAQPWLHLARCAWLGKDSDVPCDCGLDTLLGAPPRA